MTRRELLAAAVPVLAAMAAAACGRLTQRRLQGRWESVDTPKRTLDLFADGSYSRRLSGKNLGFISDLLGPERGTWRVESETLVLAKAEENGKVSEEKLPINELSEDALVLAGERWTRKALPSSPESTLAPSQPR